MELHSGSLTDEERRFWEEFPGWKQNQEKLIRKLYALAEDIDRTHKTATTAKVVATSAGVTSGVMGLLGLALAPATAGGSLMLSAASQGLGVAAVIANIITNALENSRSKRVRAQANSLMPGEEEALQDVGGEQTAYITAAGNVAYKCGSAVKTIREHTRALEIARANPRLAMAAKRLMTAGRVSTRTSKQVQKAFGGTALAMTKNARMLGGAMAAFSLGQDLFDLLKEWKELNKETSPELAEELRGKARELEATLSEFTQHYEKLKRDGRIFHTWPRRIYRITETVVIRIFFIRTVLFIVGLIVDTSTT